PPPAGFGYGQEGNAIPGPDGFGYGIPGNTIPLPDGFGYGQPVSGIIGGNYNPQNLINLHQQVYSIFSFFG
ncbi:MAG: hypothetical protein ACLFQV_06840, partial [Vulcanimicrobiota bacterium]